MARTGAPDAQRGVLMCELGLEDAALRGPAAPLPFVPAPDGGLSAWAPQAAASVWWVGCHGGAGESTLAGLLAGSAAATGRWPRRAGRPAPVLLVARTSYAGLVAAQTALRQWAAGATPEVDLLGLVLSADAPGRVPRPLGELAQVVGGGAPRVWALPWIGAWRTGEPACPRPVARLLASVTALLPPDRFYPDLLPFVGASKEGC